jgi:adenine deaminase
MVTLNPAEMFGMADRIGSIAPGKDADFIVLEGHPFDYNALPQMVYIDGQRVYEAAPPASRQQRQSEHARLVPMTWFVAGLSLGMAIVFVRRPVARTLRRRALPWPRRRDASSY